MMRGPISTMALAIPLLLLGSNGDPTRFARPPQPPAFALPAKGVLFSDHFVGDLSQWKPDQAGVWSLWHGMLRGDLPDRKQARSLIYAGATNWKDYALDLDVCMMRGVDKGAVVRVEGERGIAVDLRGGAYQDIVMYMRESQLGKAAVTNANGTWNHLRIEARGTRYKVFVNGQLVIDRGDSRRPRGRIALPAYTGGYGECTVYYDNVVVTALE